MIELKFSIGLDSFENGNFIYIWIDGANLPFYVGETGKSPIDRAGLHIRDKSRSGAIVSKIIQLRSAQKQDYTVLAFPIEDELLTRVCQENGASTSNASYNRARKAIERAVYEELSKKFKDLHKARGCNWQAKSGVEYVKYVCEQCIKKGA
ncbi:hypothetical protein [Saccharophagus degradans]|uniref:GIY-YIG domain-containing protein n=1 Tax=Saccharophagus degradans TaxID=86304 RepID=A0AAW7X1N6_9GAMM|nr:hypothetical protein [Saccharophagus degradans]MDO6420847.1 hypothetical protein [Saccharophagus degradans]MDO6609800.1 hypothetical protein [Saccharophagus degradans]